MYNVGERVLAWCSSWNSWHPAEILDIGDGIEVKWLEDATASSGLTPHMIAKAPADPEENQEEENQKSFGAILAEARQQEAPSYRPASDGNPHPYPSPLCV